MFLVYYPCIRGEDLPYYSKSVTWNLLHAYIDAHSQILIDEYPVDGVQATSRLKPQYANTIFADQRRYNRFFSE